MARLNTGKLQKFAAQNIVSVMLKAGTFIYSLFIMFIVSMLTLLFLTQTRLFSVEIDRMYTLTKLLDNMESGINFYLGSEDIGKGIGSYEFDLFGFGTDSIMVEHYRWGFYNIIHAEAVGNNQQLVGCAMLGYQSRNPNTSLYLKAQSGALYVSGSCRIVGDAHLPEQGVRAASVAGEGYFGDRLVYGKQHLSSSELPIKIDTDFNWPSNTTIDALESVEHSFFDSTLYYYSEDALRLEDIVLKGNIILDCNSNIDILPSAKLEDVIIRAPKITIHKGSRISAQLMATDSIIVREAAIIDYPSILYVTSNEEGYIGVGSEARLYGDILYKGKKEPEKSTVNVNIEQGAVLTGRLALYDGNLQLNGAVIGEVYAHGIVLHHPVGIFHNYLLSAVIDRESLWDDYLFPSKLRSDDQARVLKWLN